MPELSLDFGNVGKVPPDGTYRFTVVKAKVKLNKAKDGKYINFQFALTDSPDEAFEGHTVWDKGSLKKAGLWRTQEILEAITQEPWQDDDMSLTVNDDDEVEFLHDQTFMASCEQDLDYKGKDVLVIKSYFPDDGTVEIEVATEEAEPEYEVED
jgi:hypothetical protein